MPLSAAPPPQSVALDYYQDLYRFAYSLAQHPADASDLTQFTYMKFTSHGHTIKDVSKTKSWLFTTLHREFLNQRRRVVRFPQTTLDEGRVEEISGGENSALHENLSDVMLALGKLEETLRAPLTLFYLKDMKYREIAEVLEVPIGTVMSRLARAKQALRGLLGLEHAQPPTFDLSLA